MTLAVAVAAFLLLSVPLSVRFSEPWSVLRPSFDVVALVGLAAAAKLLAPRGRLLVMYVLGAALMSAIVYRFAWEVFPRFFGRPLRVKHDLWLLPNLYDLLFDSLDAWRAGAALVAITALVALGSPLEPRVSTSRRMEVFDRVRARCGDRRRCFRWCAGVAVAGHELGARRGL